MMVTKMFYIYFGTVMVLLPWRQATKDGELIRRSRKDEGIIMDYSYMLRA